MPPTAVKGTQLYEGFSLSPNPASSHLRLQLNDDVDAIVEVRLIDVLGRSTLWMPLKKRYSSIAESFAHACYQQTSELVVRQKHLNESH